MHPTIKKKVQQNADYHAAMADYYTGLQTATNGDEAAPTGKRGAKAAAAQKPTALCPFSGDDLTKLVAMHSGAAAQLAALVANDPPQQILRQRAKPPVTRGTPNRTVH